ncbi:hypothetical protein KKG08_00620 [Patescibacteria group bacterium]|nr:hypothetical protein [Patescibacteria group bacterium]
MKENNNKNIFPLVLIVGVILILVGGAYWYSQQMKKLEPEKPAEPSGVRIIDASESTEEEAIVDEEMVEEEDTEEVSEEITEDELVTILSQLFADKYEKDLSEVNLSIDEIQGSYVSGGVSFEGEISGAYFYAAEVGGEWSIVFDGNGTTPCDVLEAVDFPVDMAPECWDEINMELVVRE